MITVASAWAPRFDRSTMGAKGTEALYLKLFRIQRASVERFPGHRHLIYSDAPVPGCDVRITPLNVNFSRAMVEAQRAAIEAWDDVGHLVLADGDVVIERALDAAFDGTFDIGVTNREVASEPVNNGVIYLRAGSRAAGLAVWDATLAVCGTAWGEDQLALARALAPVPLKEHRNEPREIAGVKFIVGFLPCATFNMTPHVNGREGDPAYAYHYKGDRKQKMLDYAARTGLQWA